MYNLHINLLGTQQQKLSVTCVYMHKAGAWRHAHHVHDENKTHGCKATPICASLAATQRAPK